MIIMNSIGSNLPHYTVYNATKSAEIKAIFGGFRALVGSKGLQMLDS